MRHNSTRLGRANLDRLPSAIRRPAYDRSRVTPGIVHLGLGAFHRAHQAVVIDDCLAAGGSSWGIVGASLRSPDTRDALAPQDHLYTVAVRAAEGTEHRVIGALLDSVVAREKPAALVDRMADPAIRIVSLTVTEKGYCHTPQTCDLDERHPDVVHDLNNFDAPRSAPGFIVAALARRRAQGLAPFTVLCCDNLAANGHTVQRIVTQFAALRSKDLGKWIADSTAFPSTMVDRIVPETTDADRDAISNALGMRDAWPVMTEPFTQWVVEDRFTAGRPDFAAAGVELVTDVKPFELMKLRLLNASHSALAYLGYLAGYETIADTMLDPHFARLAAQVMEEAAVTLTMPVGTDLAIAPRCSSASPTRRCITVPGRSRWTARRSFRSACSARCRIACAKTCRSRRMRSRWPAGCVTSPHATSRAAPSTFAIRSPPSSPRWRARRVPSPNGSRPHCSGSRKCSDRWAPNRACARP